jgi:SAM-dependent methyltransferase
VLRLNLGCGPQAAPGWLNCDLRDAPGVSVRADLRRGLPFADATFDCIAAIHVLQDLAWPELAPALAELRRVLKPGGVLRLALPDRDARSLGAQLVTQIIWYGSVRTPFTFDFAEEWLRGAGFGAIERSSFGCSRLAGLAALDNRRRETLFIEARK